MASTLIVPGLHGSGPAHWQSWLEALLPDARRVHQDDWSCPALPAWAERVTAEIDHAHGPVLLVAHSFGCLASAVAAARRPQRVAGLLLVAPADPDKFGVAATLPATPFAVPSLVVASTNDPWVGLGTARAWAQRWGSRLVNVGAKGHINTDAGFGPWPEGHALYESLAQAAALRTPRPPTLRARLPRRAELALPPAAPSFLRGGLAAPH
jgi:predicted alpha/beta hydrolase family esterase